VNRVHQNGNRQSPAASRSDRQTVTTSSPEMGVPAGQTEHIRSPAQKLSQPPYMKVEERPALRSIRAREPPGPQHGKNLHEPSHNSRHTQWAQHNSQPTPYLLVPICVPIMIPHSPPLQYPWLGDKAPPLPHPQHGIARQPPDEQLSPAPPRKMRIPPASASSMQSRNRSSSITKMTKYNKRRKSEALPASQYALMSMMDIFAELEYRTIDTSDLRRRKVGKEECIGLLQRADRNGNRGRGIWFAS
jgi:hypothetical protein